MDPLPYLAPLPAQRLPDPLHRAGYLRVRERSILRTQPDGERGPFFPAAIWAPVTGRRVTASTSPAPRRVCMR